MRGGINRYSYQGLSTVPLNKRQQFSVFQEVLALFTARLGKTTVMEHVIRLKDGRPMRQQPYHIPQQLVEKLREEVEAMLELGVVEPSISEWCSPVVIVCKKDCSLCICIDFWKLNFQTSKLSLMPIQCPGLTSYWRKLGQRRI